MPTSGQRIVVIQVIARMNVGGPAVLVDSVHRRLDRSRFDPRLLTGDVSDQELDYLEVHGSPEGVRRVAGLGRSIRPFDDLRAFVSLVRLFRDEKPDIVHTHTAKAGVLGRLAAIVSRVPVRVHTFHGHVLHGYFSPLVGRCIALIEKVLASRTTALVAVGEHVRDDLLAAGIGRRDRYTVVAPGVSVTTTADKSEARRRLNLPEDAPVVLFVGRLTRIKRPDRLVDTFQRVREALPSAILVVVGEGDLADDTRLRARSLGDNVHFLGWRSDVSTIYPIADVALLTSDNEGMPVTLIEASMLGVPCVTTDVGSAGDVVIDGETGFVVPPSDASLAAAVTRLLLDADLARRMGDRARVHAHAEFGVERLVDDHAALYERLVRKVT